MFRDKRSAYDRLHDAISDIGGRISELEQQVVERVNPTPSTTERVRRSISRHLPGHNSHSLADYVPDFARNVSLPTTDDARSVYHSAAGSLSNLRSSISDWAQHLPDFRRVANDTRSYLPDPRLPRFGSFRKGMQAQRGVDRLGGNDALTTALIAGGVLVAVGGALYVTKKIADHTEEPDYDVVRRDGEVEIRDYDGMVIAETVKSGYHEKARKIGFTALADYISANNRSGKKIPMTAPVLQQLAESEGQTKGWAIRFVMPKKYSISTLPSPASNEIKLKDVAPRRIAAIRFSGNFTASLASKKLMMLYNYIADENLKQKGDPVYAFYNPPWTPGFLKRNEILIEIER